MGLNIPDECGVMILPDCTLFPQGGLPLYIFEERYRRMLEAALEGDCMFAVARSSKDEKGEVLVSDVGTIGLIRASKQSEDGTSELLLHGIIRVRFLEWMVDAEYPKAKIEPVVSLPMQEDADKAARRMLRGMVEDFLADSSQEVRTVMEMLAEQCIDAGMMADLMADRLVGDAEMRQGLLETPDAGSRVAKLCGILGVV